jgi:hypothetical protein
MKANSQKHCGSVDCTRFSSGIFLVAALLLSMQPAFAQSSTSQARMSQMLNQFEQGKRPTYSTGGGYARGSASGMPGYAKMMGGRPSNLGGYAGRSNGGNSQMMQLMKAKMSRMQSGGGGSGNSLMQLMRQRQGGAPHMMPGMGGGPGAGMGMQSGLFAKMMQQDTAFNNTMKRNQMNQGMGMPGMMGMRRPGMGMNRSGGMGMGSGMGMSGMGRPAGMGMSGGGGMLGRMQPKMNAPRAGSPFAPKQAAPAKTGTMSDLEKAMESQYGK